LTYHLQKNLFQVAY